MVSWSNISNGGRGKLKVDVRDGMSAMSVLLAGIAIIGAIAAVGFGMRAIDEAKGAVADASAEKVKISLSEFVINPKVVEAP